MIPNKIGQIAKYHTPLPDENPNQLFVVLEIFLDVERPRAIIKEINTGLLFTLTKTRFVEDLEVVNVNTTDLVGHKATIRKNDYSQITGKVTKVNQENVMLDLNKVDKGVETNVWITIQDEIGIEHSGTLFVNPA